MQKIIAKIIKIATTQTAISAINMRIQEKSLAENQVKNPASAIGVQSTKKLKLKS